MFDDEFNALEVMGLNVIGKSVFIDVHADDVIFIGAKDEEVTLLFIFCSEDESMGEVFLKVEIFGEDIVS
jgi:predicted RNA-binding protein